MIIDYNKEFRTDAKTDKDLWRTFTDERIMQGLAIQLSAGEAPSGMGKELNSPGCYLGYWPMFYSEALLMQHSGHNLDELMPDIAKGVALCMNVLNRPKKHIPFVEAVLFWDYLFAERLVTLHSTQDFIGNLLAEVSASGNYRNFKTDVFSLNHPSCVERHKFAIPIISEFLSKNNQFAEALFGQLNREQLRAAAMLYPADIWRPFCKSGKGKDFMLEHDLGI